MTDLSTTKRDGTTVEHAACGDLGNRLAPTLPWRRSARRLAVERPTSAAVEHPLAATVGLSARSGFGGKHRSRTRCRGYRVPVRVFVFGAARVEGRPDGSAADHATPVDIGARKPRSIVAALAMTPGRPVSPGLLADLVWAGEPPPAAHGALHAYISGLRKALEPDRRARAAASVLETTDHGYLLNIDREAVDVHRFGADVRAAERSLAPLAGQLGHGEAASWPDRTQTAALVEQLDEALAAWHGEPYADLPDHPDVLAERAALDRLRVGGGGGPAARPARAGRARQRPLDRRVGHRPRTAARASSRRPRRCAAAVGAPGRGA